MRKSSACAFDRIGPEGSRRAANETKGFERIFLKRKSKKENTKINNKGRLNVKVTTMS